MTYSAVQMKRARLELRITQEMLDAIDAARGDVSRTRWVERAIERALEPVSGSLELQPRGPVLTQPVPTVKRASSVGMDRQARLNAERAKKK